MALIPKTYTTALTELANKREPFAVATVVRTQGSSLAKPGFKIVVDAEGKVRAGTLGGVCPEGPIIQIALDTMVKSQPRMIRVHLEDVEAAVSRTIASHDPDEIHVETNCGGRLEIYVEPFLPPDRLILIGQGGKDDVEDDLIRLGKLLGFEVVVIDPNPALTENPHQLLRDLDFDLSSFSFSRTDSVIVLTKGARDVEVLETLSRVPLRFVGLMASNKRIQQDVDALKEKGVTTAFLNALHAPVGLDIGAITPMEITLSIMAQVVATKYGKGSAFERTAKMVVSQSQ